MSTSALDALLRPASVAVVGASDQIHKVGGRPLHYLLTQGFKGRLYAVNPRVAEVQGLPAYDSIDALPEVPDAAILCVPAGQVEAELRRCGRRGVRQVVLFASGYAEVGSDGAQRQQTLDSICAESGMRLLGPNTIGSANFATGAVLSFASIYADHPPLDGPVAIVSQSGAFGVSAYALLRGAGLGVRYVVATGNEGDLQIADVVAELVRDDGIRLMLLYLEGVKDVERLRAALLAARRRGVAVIAVRAARSAQGRRAAAWHTGADGAANAELDAMFAACGCRTAADLIELVASVPLYLNGVMNGVNTGANVNGDGAARATLGHGLPRIALVSNSGASCVISADVAEVLGLPLADLSEATRAMLDGWLPAFSLSRNPIDLTAMLLAEPALLGRVITAVLADASVDATCLGLIAIGGPSYDVPRFARDCFEASQRAAKPLVVHSPHQHVQAVFAQQGLAVYATESQALEGLRAHALHQQALR